MHRPHSRRLLPALAALVAAALVAFPGVAQAASAPASGSVSSSGPTDTYPTGSPTPCVSQSGAATHYATIPFTTDGAAATTIDLTVHPTGFRAVIALYQGGYLPGNPIVNCYNGSAIGSSAGASVSWSAAFGALPPGFTSEPWTLVVWGATAADVGSFTATISSTNTGVTVTSSGGGIPADTTPPVVTVPTDETVEATSPSGAPFTFAASATDDTDGAVTTSCSRSSGSTFPIGQTTVTCSASDAAGNAGSASFKVTVRDTTAPVVHVPAGLSAEASGPSGAVVAYTATATDAVGAPSPTCTPASGSTFPIGATTVTCTSQDASGNTGSATFSVDVADTTGPVITVPADQTAEATGAGGAAVTFVASATDAVDGALTPTCVPASGSTFPVGSTTVTCTADDAAGNTGSASFKVDVGDTGAPTVTVPGDRTIEATGPGGAVTTFSPTATDTVDGDLTPTCAPASGSTFALGSTTVTCTAKDAAGNTGTATFHVTVEDTTAPVLTVPAAVDVPAAERTGAPVDFDATAADLVDGAVPTSCTPAAGSHFAVGSTDVTCTATDAAGNASTATFTVTVRPVRDPRITVAVSGTGQAGWFRSAARVTFTCTPGTGAILGGCPAPVLVSADAVGRLVAGTVHASDGGTATVSVRVNVDRTAPRVRIAGVAQGNLYLGSAPRARCVAQDRLSGVASCRLRRTVRGDRVTVTAVARDRAGNASTTRKSYRQQAAYLAGAKREGGRFVVHSGSTYLLKVAGPGPAPVYLQAAVEGRQPHPAGPVLQPAGKGQWQIRIRITPDMLSTEHWVIGVRFSDHVELVHLTIRR